MLQVKEEPRVGALVADLYDQLRVIARAQLRRERPGHTLGATALVHETYLRLVNQQGLTSIDRTRFFAAVSTTMRRVLVDHARRRRSKKRGSGVHSLPLDAAEAVTMTGEEADELIALDDALERLDRLNARASRVVQLRFFGGLTLEETADLLGVSTKTVQRDWIITRSWLRKEVAHALEMT
jgi:RNA polymerase sigma factor (TIGR02999 family)